MDLTTSKKTNGFALPSTIFPYTLAWGCGDVGVASAPPEESGRTHRTGKGRGQVRGTKRIAGRPCEDKPNSPYNPSL